MAKLSQRDQEEIFKDIVKWVRAQGCKVYCQKKSKTVYGSNGYFTPDPEPHIKMGLKGKPLDKSIVLLLHEFGHYWQWVDGFLDRKDDEGNEIYGVILEGGSATPAETDKARKLVAVSEYDCEKRTAYLLRKWNLEAIRSLEDHIKFANSYNRHAAWSIGSGKNPGSAVFYPEHESMADKLWPGKKKHKWFTAKQIEAPISAAHKKKFDAAYARHSRNNKKRSKRVS